MRRERTKNIRGKEVTVSSFTLVFSLLGTDTTKETSHVYYDQKRHKMRREGEEEEEEEEEDEEEEEEGRLEEHHQPWERRGGEEKDFEEEEEKDGEDWRSVEENVATTREGEDGTSGTVVDAFMATSLRDLSAIRRVPAKNPPLVKIRIINCPNVKRVPSGCFERCEKTLRELWVCECNLENLDGLKGLEFESLEVLALYGNKIEEVKSVFCSGDDGEETKKKPFQKLKRLMLNENKIREIGESFNHIESLECIDLSENLLTGEEWVLQRTKKSGNNEDEERKRREWFRSVTTLNLAANPINNDYIVSGIAEHAKNIVDLRFRDDISGACPIARGNYDITTLMDLSDTAYSRYASKCVATFGKCLKFLDGYELTPSLRESLLEQHNKRRALYYPSNDKDLSDCFREAAITPLFLDERAIIIHSEKEKFAHNKTKGENASFCYAFENDMASVSRIEAVDVCDVTFLELPPRVRSETLVSLKIRSCSLASLEGIRSCTYLHYLDASSNRIRTLDSAWFVGLKQLMYMDLSDNDIKNIERDALLFVQEKCPNLRHLRLARNQIRTLRELQNLLEMNAGDIFSTHRTMCTADPSSISLKFLDLRGNAVTNLENYRECVAYFAQCLVLLDGDEVREVWRRKGRFLFQGRLTTEMIERKLARNTDENDILDLSEMRVRRLDEESVSGDAMMSAKIVNLEKNHLTDVSALRSLKHLRRLSMSKNALRYALVRETFVNGNIRNHIPVDEENGSSRYFYEQFFPQLRELDVRYNRMDSRRLVRLQLQKLQLLSFVDVSNNRLQDLDGLKNLPHLRKIRADENPLRQFNEYTFLGFDALESLSIKRCGVRSFAHLNTLTNVKSLRLDGNRMKDKELAFKQLAGMIGLKKLSLRGCKFASSYFDEAVFALETLDFLDGIEITREDRERIQKDMEERKAREEALKFQETTLNRVQVVMRGLGGHVFHRPLPRILTSTIR